MEAKEDLGRPVYEGKQINSQSCLVWKKYNPITIQDGKDMLLAHSTWWEKKKAKCRSEKNSYCKNYTDG
jgi:hypothetical protein